MLGFFGPLYEQLVGMLRKQQGQLAFDEIDRLNAWFTPFVLVAMTFAISCKQYFGQPLKCWTPREFSGSWDGYVHDFCFIENTYFVPNGTEVTDEARGGRHINYYRWVPLVLLMQAAMFVVPYSIWNQMHKKTIINLKGSLRFFEGALKKNEPAKACEMFANEIWLKLVNMRENPVLFGASRATINYFLLKLGFVINAMLQMVLLKNFLGVEDYGWGFVHLWNVEFKGTAEHEDSVFPRVVLCDFKVRNLGQQHQHTVSCIMLLNMIIEKLYIVFYFWLLLVFVITLTGMIKFGSQMLINKQSLIPTKLYNKIDATRARRFLKEVLNYDGVLLVTYIDAQFGAYRASQVVNALVDRFIAEDHAESESSTISSMSEEQPAFQKRIFDADTLPLNRGNPRYCSFKAPNSGINEVDGVGTLVEEIAGPSAPVAEPVAAEQKKDL